MKSPVEYLSGHVFEACRPRCEMQPVVAYSTAVQAIEQALADAEKYKYLLMRALRRHDQDVAAATTAESSPSFFDEDAAVRPLYPSQELLAA